RTRADALQRMREALAQCEVVGPKSNIDFLERLVRHPAVIEGRIDTGYLDRHLDEFLPAGDAQADAQTLFAAATAVLVDEESRAAAEAANASDPHSPWARADGWRLGHLGRRIVCFMNSGQRIEVDAFGARGDYRLASGEVKCVVSGAQARDGMLSASFDGIARRYRARVAAADVLLHDGDRRVRLERTGAFAFAVSAQQTADRVVAPMPGRIVLIKAKAGDKVDEGQELLVMEAMKMELTLRASHAATIASVHAQVGDFVEAEAVLMRFGDGK
ncbi:MAG TPA: biotin/lipoyl-containing protein, partial [Rudaea sp.]|nr:biotin/lipoyl-containing protein [Rudaea sp.]